MMSSKRKIPRDHQSTAYPCSTPIRISGAEDERVIGMDYGMGMEMERVHRRITLILRSSTESCSLATVSTSPTSTGDTLFRESCRRDMDGDGDGNGRRWGWGWG